MSVIATALKHMLAAGMDHDAIVLAVAEMEKDIQPVRTATREIRDLGISADEWRARRALVFARDEYSCVYCGKDVSENPQCDHLVPLIQGGSSEIENLVTSCKRCNSSKSGKRPDEWRASWR